MQKTNKFLIAASLCMVAGVAEAQSAFDLYSISQSDLRGSARFMSMGGAFGALGGNVSTLSQNPGGIGVYRSSEIGFSLGWNLKNAEVANGQDGTRVKNTNFNFDNFGYVGSISTGSRDVPIFNWGFSVDNKVSFNRHYSGRMPNIGNSMTNYVANQTNGWYADDLGAVAGSYNPYQQSYAPWMSILAYNSYLINPTNPEGTSYTGLFQNGTTGFSEFDVVETGQVYEYNLAFGGNAREFLYWGATLGITDLEFNQYSYYGEALEKAYVPYAQNDNLYYGDGTASWGMENHLRLSGTGVNFKMGVILKPVNELRIGFAFHTPTFYSVRAESYASTSYAYQPYDQRLVNSNIQGTAETDEGYVAVTDFNAKTPWRFIGSVAGVFGGRCILSMDYERIMYDGMRVSYSGTEDSDVADQVGLYFKPSNIIRVGGEFKVTPQFSLRAGYSLQTSPVTSDIKDDQIDVITAGTTLSYGLDTKTQYITAGLGYRYRSFYIDMAYVHKNRNSDYHAFSSEADTPLPPMATVKDSNNEIVLSAGFRF